ncbi:hypothetical protein [Sphingobium yanoikuyae]|uniref:hypothetical protein n=1 Tax=Sphingobium yanoikuyae TaxID=13690 RepID=UPI0035C6E66C
MAQPLTAPFPRCHGSIPGWRAAKNIKSAGQEYDDCNIERRQIHDVDMEGLHRRGSRQQDRHQHREQNDRP